MRAADCFAFASHAEGVPNVVLEAMAAGLPAAATSVGGIPEIIADGVTGLLVPPRDAPALAAAVDRLLRNPDQGARMAGAARAFVRRHFDVDRNAEVLVPLLERVARGESAEGPFPCCAGASAGQLPTITSPDEAA
jgi:glycosyltransferase involved in cell wall biosynthesis